jgi:SAM-dependent methyltransferase
MSRSLAHDDPDTPVSGDDQARPALAHAYPRLGPYGQLARDPLHGRMRHFADDFLARNRDALREYAAQWVADPLHHWSRRWEYPYVFEQLEAWCRAHPGARPRVLDAGSGLTFFPHFLASTLPIEGVECRDRDPAIARDAARLGAPASLAVRYDTGDLADLGFRDASFDCVYCISVLEHTAERARIADEFARVLRPDGLLVVTIDVSLDGRAEIPRAEAARLIEALGRRFRPLGSFAGLVAEPPADVLTTRTVASVEPALMPPRTYASAGGVLRRLLRPWSFPWGKAFRRLLGRAGGGAGASEVTFFCTAWTRPDPAAPGTPGSGGTP